MKVSRSTVWSFLNPSRDLSDFAECASRPSAGFRAGEDGAEVGGGETFGGLEAGFGGGPRPLHRRHLLIQDRRNPLLLLQWRKRDLESLQVRLGDLGERCATAKSLQSRNSLSQRKE